MRLLNDLPRLFARPGHAFYSTLSNQQRRLRPLASKNWLLARLYTILSRGIPGKLTSRLGLSCPNGGRAATIFPW